jgi:hypothetical protein
MRGRRNRRVKVRDGREKGRSNEFKEYLKTGKKRRTEKRLGRAEFKNEGQYGENEVTTVAVLGKLQRVSRGIFAHPKLGAFAPCGTHAHCGSSKVDATASHADGSFLFFIFIEPSLYAPKLLHLHPAVGRRWPSGRLPDIFVFWLFQV